MSRFYRFVHAVGFKPCEQDAENVAPQLRALLTREEADRNPPYGSALDLGCGTGRWSVELAQRGWDATGIDLIPKAVLGARRRAEKSGIQARFVEGSVTALRAADVGAGFQLVLDVECFNHLSDEQRVSVGKKSIPSQDRTRPSCCSCGHEPVGDRSLLAQRAGTLRRRSSGGTSSTKSLTKAYCRGRSGASIRGGIAWYARTRHPAEPLNP